MNRAFVSVAVLGLLVGHAAAADLPVKTPWPAPPIPVFTWTACYLGAIVGGGWGHKEFEDPTVFVTGTAAVPSVTVSPSGWLLGAQAGCDFQFAPNEVFGIEGSFSGGRLKGHSDLVPSGAIAGDNAIVTARLDALATLTGRLGYAIDRTLLYGKAGFAWADEQFSTTGLYLGTPFDIEGPAGRFAWTVGAGVEWAFSDYWAVRLEYDFYDFGNHGVTFIDENAGATVGSLPVKQTIQTVKLGLSFRYMWMPPAGIPVVTK
jgi:outer membrane immunogenic protein